MFPVLEPVPVPMPPFMPEADVPMPPLMPDVLVPVVLMPDMPLMSEDGVMPATIGGVEGRSSLKGAPTFLAT